MMGGGLWWVGVLLTEARSLGEGGRQWGEWDGVVGKGARLGRLWWRVECDVAGT